MSEATGKRRAEEDFDVLVRTAEHLRAGPSSKSSCAHAAVLPCLDRDLDH